MSGPSRPDRSRSLGRILRPVAAAVLVALLASVAISEAVLAGSIAKVTACDGVNLRTRALTGAPRKATVKAGTRVTITATVTGSRYTVDCAGKRTTGTGWYRISTINGRSVSSLYHVSYLYGAGALFRAPTAPTVPKVAACDGVNLRDSAATTGARKATIDTLAPVSVVGTVTGGTWATTCGDKAVSGSGWYRISAVNGKSAASLYGVSYVYGATGLFGAPGTVAVPTPTPTPTPPAASPYSEGIDVSHWQNVIDWPSVRAAGKRFTYIKASESTDFVDWMYATNRAQAKAAGLYVGAYHFADPDMTPGDAAAEADHFVDTAGVTRGDLLPVLDLEATGGLSTVNLQAWVAAYLDRVYQRTGVRGVIYVSPSFWKNYMGDASWFATNGYGVLWIAHWTTSAQPSVPAGGWGGSGWTFWQYTSDGAVPGIAGRVDLNRYNGTNFSSVLVQ